MKYIEEILPLVKDVGELEVGREYWLRDKATGTLDIGVCQEAMKRKFFTNSRGNGTPEVSEAMQRLDIIGPLAIRVLKAVI